VDAVQREVVRIFATAVDGAGDLADDDPDFVRHHPLPDPDDPDADIAGWLTALRSAQTIAWFTVLDDEDDVRLSWQSLDDEDDVRLSWQSAYAQRGAGSTFARARIIASDVYDRGAPIPTVSASPDQNRILRPAAPRNVDCATRVVQAAGSLRTWRWRRPEMPAVTVENVLALPRVPAPDPVATRERPVVSVTTAPSGLEGEGFPVRRAFAGVDLGALDPFGHMDQMGEVEYAPGEPKGTPWHPHRGFETVTYMLDGEMAHQDSNGGGGLITNGDTQWMTAGAGILHIETPPEHLVASGGLFHGIQLWVNLPRTLKFAPPRYQDIRGTKVALLSSPDGGALLRVIAGELAGHPGPGSTHTPITLVHATVSPGATVTLPWRPDFNALVYTLAGTGTAGSAGRPIRTGQLAVFGDGDTLTIAADPRQPAHTPTLDVLILGGRPIREPVAAYGPFVMNTKAELLQAFEDYQAGRLGSIPAAHADVRAETPAE